MAVHLEGTPWDYPGEIMVEIMADSECVNSDTNWPNLNLSQLNLHIGKVFKISKCCDIIRSLKRRGGMYLWMYILC